MFSPLLYILYVVRHSILRDGSGPGRLNRHRQEILTFWKYNFFSLFSSSSKFIPECGAFYLYPVLHLDVCNGRRVPAELVST